LCVNDPKFACGLACVCDVASATNGDVSLARGSTVRRRERLCHA
jgi:hypothetical protein